MTAKEALQCLRREFGQHIESICPPFVPSGGEETACAVCGAVNNLILLKRSGSMHPDDEYFSVCVDRVACRQRERDNEEKVRQDHERALEAFLERFKPLN